MVSVKDAFKDPILPGDYLYNPIFHPGGEQHVVIAGRIDMHGTKGDDLEEFERLLKRQNVVVDGYVDPQSGDVKGRLTVGTDYLMLGDDSRREGRDAGGGQPQEVAGAGAEQRRADRVGAGLPGVDRLPYAVSRSRDREGAGTKPLPYGRGSDGTSPSPSFRLNRSITIR